ncbi:hypothetical protein BU17DRAFT_101090 [Hysterangium stoloniferum]|nr:hypothetical protein BU17DRAFT_101090 [Hysterangium stoloniferum]
MLAPKATTDYDLTKKRLLRKLDTTLLPMVTLLFLIMSFDKAAVGNAKIAGLERDLGLIGLDFNIGVSVYYVTHFACQLPSNMALRLIGPVWLSFLVISFGIVSISTAFIGNYAGFLVTRIMLGLTEGGLVPGIVYILSLYYPRSELTAPGKPVAEGLPVALKFQLGRGYTLRISFDEKAQTGHAQSQTRAARLLPTIQPIVPYASIASIS